MQDMRDAMIAAYGAGSNPPPIINPRRYPPHPFRERACAKGYGGLHEYEHTGTTHLSTSVCAACTDSAKATPPLRPENHSTNLVALP